MAKTYTIDLPITQPRPLRYTRTERLEYEKRFRHFGLPGMREIVLEKAFPIRPDPTDDDKPKASGGGDLEAQEVLIWLGIRHNNPKFLTEEKVAELLQLAVSEKRPLVSFTAVAVNAVLASGVLGYVYEWEVVAEEEPGKAPATGSESSSSA